MGKIDLALKTAKLAASSNEKIKNSLEYMKDVGTGVGKLNQTGGGATTTRSSSGSFSSVGNFFVKFAILIPVALIFIKFFPSVMTYSYELIVFVLEFFPIISVGSYIWFSYYIVFMIISMIYMGIFKSGEKAKDLLGLELKILFFSFIAVFIVSFFLGNTVDAEGNRIEAAENFNSAWSNLMNDYNCIVNKGSEKCNEEKINTEVADGNNDVDYTVKLISSQNTNYRTVEYYNERGIKAQFEILGEGNLYLEEFRCYVNSKREKNVFYSEKLDEEIFLKNSGTKTFYCQNLTSEKLKIVDEQDVSIYPTLIIRLDSVITKEIPIVNYDLFLESTGIEKDSDEYRDELEKFAEDNDDFKDSGSKFEISAFPKTGLFPVVLGDDEKTDRSFTLTIKKKSTSNFGKFISGEVLDIRVPSSLTLVGDKDIYLEKLELESESYEADFRLEDNEGMSFDQAIIKQIFEMDYTGTFYSTGSLRLKIKMNATDVQNKLDEAERLKKEAEDAKANNETITNVPEVIVDSKINDTDTIIIESGVDTSSSDVDIEVNTSNNDVSSGTVIDNVTGVDITGAAD